MTKKFRLSAIFTFVAILILSIMASASLLVSPARATENSTSGVFQMEYGASIQLSKNGLRFKAKMSEDYYEKIMSSENVTLYGFIARVEEFDRVIAYSDFITGGKRVGGVLDKEKIYLGEDGYYYVNIVMTNLAEGNRGYQDDSFSAIVFIEDKTSGSAKYTYAEFAKDESGHVNIEAQNRLQYDVVNSAFLDGKESYESRIISAYGSWYGTAEYPIVINTEEQYKSLVAKLSANTVFANSVQNRHVFIKLDVANAVSSYDASQKIEKYVTTVTETQGHTVTFWDGNKIVARQFVADGAEVDLPDDPTHEGYVFIGWIGDTSSITEDSDVYAKWEPSKGSKITFANGTMSSYGVSVANGNQLTSNSTADAVIGQKVVLASGVYSDGAHPSGSNYATVDGSGNAQTPTPGKVDQAYLAYDGTYGFNDYIAFDFTGKNMPSVAFFANSYNNSMYYENGGKSGVVVLTGVTEQDGSLYVLEDKGDLQRMDMFNGKGLVVCGPEMAGYINSVGVNGTFDFDNGVATNSDNMNTALGRANLDNNTKYRVIMGMQKSGNALVVVYRLYNLETGELVEDFSAQTWAYFSESMLGKSFDSYASGSIVLYGHFGTPVILDKTYPIYEDTTLDGAWRQSCGSSFNDRVSFSGDSVILGEGIMGSPTNGYIGPSLNDNGDQAYYAFDGEYGLGDYVAFDFTGKNMPEVAFFAKNYDGYMYAEDFTKQGIVVASGVMMWDGSKYSSLGSNCTKVAVSGPFMGLFQAATEGKGGNMMADFPSALARQNLVDGTHYRVIIGFSEHNTKINLHIYLYNLDTGEVVENSTTESYEFFTGSDEKVGNMTTDDLVGSIVLYGKFYQITTTIDKIHGVFEDTTVLDIVASLEMNQKTITFKNYDGTLLSTQNVSVGIVPEYVGEIPTRPSDAIFESYEFIGWDKELTAVTENAEYTAVFERKQRENVNVTTSPDVTLDGDKVILGAGSIGDGANYTIGQNNDDGKDGPSYVHQSYLAFDGNYDLNDYIAFDFTGKNMPEVAFFAKNYNDSMYAEGTSKQGIVVVTGITTYNGGLDSGVNGNGTQINYGYPYMIQNAADGGFVEGAFANSALGRANLVDGTHYRVIMGFTEHNEVAKITLKWCLYNLDTNTVVEQSSMSSWGYLDGINHKARGDLSGSIVLYGKFGTTCTIDKVWGVFEDTDIEVPMTALNAGTTYTVSFTDDRQQFLQIMGKHFVYTHFHTTQIQRFIRSSAIKRGHALLLGFHTVIQCFLCHQEFSLLIGNYHGRNNLSPQILRERIDIGTGTLLIP